jgi:hypothetical protein
MSDGVKRYRADRNAEMYQIAYIDEELGKDEPDPILRDVWVADADHDALAARLEAALKALEKVVARGCGCRSSHHDDWHSKECPIPQARAVLKERPSATLQETKP